MKSLVIGLCLAISVVLPANAEWVYVDTTENNTVFTIDSDSVTEIPGGYGYVEMLVNQQENQYIMLQSQMLCKARQIRSIAYNAYNSQGQLIKSREFPNAPFKSIVINTVKATLWERLCN